MKKIFSILFFLCFLTIFGKNDIIRIAQGAKPKSLDFQIYNEFTTLGITEHIYNTLVSFDDNGIIQPDLASDFKYLSPTKILFTIKKGIKFHNGDILTSDDVIFSLNRMLSNPGGKVLIDEIKSVSQPESDKVLIELKKPSASFLGKLTLPIAGILNKKYVESGNNIGTHPMGTGPYMFEKWNSDTINLKSFKEYFKGAPKNGGIIFKVIPENSSRVMALEADDVDIIYPVSPIDFSIIESNPKLQLVLEKGVTTDYLGFNVQKDGLNNKNIRKAIKLAIDKQGILDAVFLGKGSIAKSPISSSIPGSYQDPNENRDIEAAKQIVKQYGKKLNFKIWTSENNLRIQMAQIIQSNLKEIGIDSKIEIVEWGTFLKKTSEGEHDIYLSTWILGVTDIDTIVSKLFLTDSIGLEGNKSFYSNKELDKKIKEAREINDPNKRKELYKQIQETLFEDNPVIPLIYRVDGIGINRRIKNFKHNKISMRNLYENVEIIETK